MGEKGGEMRRGRGEWEVRKKKREGVDGKVGEMRREWEQEEGHPYAEGE